MLGKIFTIVVILVALAIGILATVLPSERLHDVIMLVKFFDVMLPVLAVGALIKYLACCKKKD